MCHVQVSVGVKALPVPTSGHEYLCIFGTNWTVTGMVSPNEIKCYTPPPHLFAALFESLNRGTWDYFYQLAMRL